MLSVLTVPLLALSLSLHASAAPSPHARRADINRVASAYYTGWHSSEGAPLSDIPWDKYNTLIYAFAATTPSVDKISLDGSAPDVFPQFVSEAHDHNVAAHISIGGWAGGRWFSSNVATAENRTAFVNTINNFVQQYKLDGVNLDWEYPGKQGIGCNVVSSNDPANFLEFLKELRQTLSPTVTLSAAVPLAPYQSDVSGYAETLDYIVMMNYDIWGPWSPSVGPNAPLDDACATTDKQMGSAVSGVNAWNKAGFPIDKIVLGVPSYGHSYSVSPSNAFVKGSSDQLAAYPPFNASNQPLGDSWDNTGGTDACGVYQGPGGTWNMRFLADGSWLTNDGVPADGIYYRYDDCSKTPYIYNKTSEVMISYDNANSFAAKGQYISSEGLLGFSMWEEGGDYNNILLDSIRQAAGF
ncbi:glycoside hydrolase family 18 protein [Scleroderma yunnanense]